jgi:hypothetical protein
MKALLFAPEAYWKLTPEQKANIVNGCGPGRFGSMIVPDSLWGLSIKEACNIHDYMFAVGETNEDRDEADRVFLNNMLRLIDAAGGWWAVKALRRQAAVKYYRAVADFGGPAFWSGKNKPSELQEVTI